MVKIASVLFVALMVQVFGMTYAFAPAGLAGFTALPSLRSAACGLRMQSTDAETTEEGQNRDARRMAKKMAKKKVDGSTKSAFGVAKNKMGKPAKGGKGSGGGSYAEAAFVDELPQAEGSRINVELVGTKPEKFVMLMRYKGGILATDSSCTKCKFPLKGAEVKDDSLTCKVCGADFSLPDGAVGSESKGTLLSGLFDATLQTPLAVFPTKVQGEKILVGLNPK